MLALHKGVCYNLRAVLKKIWLVKANLHMINL